MGFRNHLGISLPYFCIQMCTEKVKKHFPIVVDLPIRHRRKKFLPSWSVFTVTGRKVYFFHVFSF